MERENSELMGPRLCLEAPVLPQVAWDPIKLLNCLQLQPPHLESEALYSMIVRRYVTSMLLQGSSNMGEL